MNRPWLLLWLCNFLVLAAIAVYVGSNQPKFSWNAQQFGFALLKGGYRSWFLSWSDGQTQDGRHVHLDRKGAWREGCRIIPRFSHVDTRRLRRDLP